MVLKLTYRRLRTKRRNKFACSKISSSMSAMLFALIFPRAQRASTYDICAERNVWLQSALRSFAIVCDYMETGLFAIVCDLPSAIVCDPRSSAIVCDHMETSLKISFGSLSIRVEPSFVDTISDKNKLLVVYSCVLSY